MHVDTNFVNRLFHTPHKSVSWNGGSSLQYLIMLCLPIKGHGLLSEGVQKDTTVKKKNRIVWISAHVHTTYFADDVLLLVLFL